MSVHLVSFVPDLICFQVLQWGHSSKVTCHPGLAGTLALVRQRFWWPTISADIRDFVLACSVCAHGKSSHQPPAGLLQPLSIQYRPRSHITMDFVTGLPPSEGNTTNLTTIDKFSQAVHFVPLSKLPLASETANLLVQHVFQLHGIPPDKVFDRGGQFVSLVWKASCQALGASVSLLLGLHPGTNAQTEQANQDLESALHCVSARHSASWSTHVPWVEYVHDSVTSSKTGTIEAKIISLPGIMEYFPTIVPNVCIIDKIQYNQTFTTVI